MNKLYITSTNPNKVLASKLIFIDYEVISISVQTEIEQPKSMEETLDCAIKRCMKIKETGLKLGLEAGVTIINNECFLVNFGVLVDNDKIYKAGGTLIPLPFIIKDAIYKEGKELKDAIQLLVNDKEINVHTGTIGYLTNDSVTRLDIFKEICKLLKGQYDKENK